MSKFSVSTTFNAVDKFGSTMRRISGSASRMSANVRRSLQAINAANARVSSGLRTIGFAAAAAATAAGVGIGKIVSAGADFESAITAVGAVGLKTREQIAPLEKEALRLGASTKFTATEAANAMEIMARAGFSTTDILSGVGGVLNAAAASGMEMAEVADHVSNALKGFGMETAQATHVADVLALASARTNSTIGTLGESIRNVAATARQLKIPFEDTVAAVASLQDVGLDASVAGSSLNTMLTKLAKPPAAVAAQMKKFGISFKDAQGDLLPFEKVIENISSAAKRSGGNLDQVGFLADLVGLRGQKAASNLAALFETGKLKELTKELSKADGVAAQMAAYRMNNLEGDWTLFKSAVDGVSVALYNLQGGPLRRVVQRATEWISANKELIISKVEGWIDSVARNLDKIVLATKRVLAVIIVFYAWQTAVKVATLATYLWQGAMWVASAAMWALSGASRVLAFLTNASTIATIAGTAATWAKAAALAVYNGLVWLGTAAITAFRAITSASTVASWALVAVTWAASAAMTARNVIVGAGTAILALFNAGTLISTARTAALTAATWLVVAATAAYNAVMLINPAVLVGVAIVALIGYLMQATGAWDAIKSAVASFASSAMGYIQPVIDKVMAFVDAVKGAASTVGSFLGFGGEPETGTGSDLTSALTGGPGPQVVSPQERVARSVSETTTTSRHELNINAPPGVASFSNPKSANKAGIKLQPSGAF